MLYDDKNIFITGDPSMKLPHIQVNIAEIYGLFYNPILVNKSNKINQNICIAMRYIKTLVRIIKVIDKQLKDMSVAKLKLLSEIESQEKRKEQLEIQLKTERDLVLNDLSIGVSHDFYQFFVFLQDKIVKIAVEIEIMQNKLYLLLEEMHNLFTEQKRYEHIINRADEEVESQEKLNEIQILDDVNIRKYINFLN